MIGAIEKPASAGKLAMTEAAVAGVKHAEGNSSTPAAPPQVWKQLPVFRSDALECERKVMTLSGGVFNGAKCKLKEKKNAKFKKNMCFVG